MIARRWSAVLLLTAALPLVNIRAARSEPLPAPPNELRDFWGRGFLRLNLPPEPDREGKVPGLAFGMVFTVLQGYVWPDRILVVTGLLGIGVTNATVVLNDTETSY